VTERLARPHPGPPRPYHFPRIEQHTLENGLRIVVAPLRRLPVVTVLGLVDAGAARDPRMRAGVASLTARLMAEGAGALEGAELTEALENVGATLDSQADWDSAVHSMTVTSDHLEVAFDLFTSILRQPTFRERELDRLKAERLSDLLQLRAEPRGLADEVFATALYDHASRYSLPEGGSEASVGAITRDDVLRFYSTWYTARTTTLIVAGDADLPTVRRLAERNFRDWDAKYAPTTPITDRPARTQRTVHLVNKDDAPQSELRVGQVGIPRSHPDYFDVVVMNALLGGLFNSRININLREAHAYTYGASSGFDWRRNCGPFVITTAVETDVTADALRETFIELDRIRSEPVSEDELSLAVSYLDGVFPIRYETTAAVASALAGQVVYGLPADYFDTYRSRIRAVTRASVLTAAQRHLDPTTMQVVVVGHSNQVRGKLEALGLGSVQRLDASALTEAR